MVVNEITVHALLVTGVDVKKSEVHGMAQRGGKVVVHLRYGSRFYSPVISLRKVDVTVAFEKMEVFRSLHHAAGVRGGLSGGHVQADTTALS